MPSNTYRWRTNQSGRACRSPWFGTACCPSNLARLTPQVPGLMYATTPNEIYCSFYAGSTAILSLEKGDIHLKQTTEYPFSETVRWEVTPGKEIQANLVKGFAIIDRAWEKGDIVELTLPMPVRYSKAIDQVQANRGCVSLTRGPVVYAAEGIDNHDRLPNVFVPGMSDTPGISTYTGGLMDGIPKVEVPAWEKNPAGNSEISLTLLPYYAWNNRDIGSMMVWFPENDAVQSYIDLHLAKHGKYKALEASYTHGRDHLMAVANKIRVLMKPQPEHAVGVLEINIEEVKN